jgi:hypothetical protein
MSRWDKQSAAGWAKTNIEDSIWKRVGKRLSLTRGWARMGIFARCFKGMYKVYMNVIHMKRKDWGIVNYLCNSLFMLDLFVAHI